MISDEELLTTVVRESLHKLYPASEVGVVDFPPPRPRLRFGYVVYGALTAIVIASVAVGAALWSHTSSRPTPTPAASVTASPWPSAPAGPAWAQVCISRGVRADDYIGLTFAAAVARAAPEHITVLIVGLDGRCLPVATKVFVYPMWVAVDHGVVVEARYQGWTGPPR